MLISLILLRKINEMSIHSKYFLAASAAKGLLRQPRKGFLGARGGAPRTFQEANARQEIF
jgi:hypothetical protein